MRHDINRILTEEEKHIVYCSKDDWFDIKDNNQDWDKSYDKISLFWKFIRKIISYDIRFNVYINLDNVSFPSFEKISILDGAYLKDDNFFDKDEENIFQVDASFISATFYARANFLGSHFKDKAIFDKAIFKEEALFNKSQFQEETSFKGVLFEKEAHFKFTKFYKTSDFSRAYFSSDTNFRNAIFYNIVSFRKVISKGDLFFWGSEFRSKVDFWSMRCEAKAEWVSAKFLSNVFLWDIHFVGSTNFDNSTFKFDVLFKNTYFKDVSFLSTIFEKSVDFSYTRFQKGIFRDTCFYEVNFEQSVFEYAILTNILGFDKGIKRQIKSSNIANKETARIIKNFSIKKNNISDMNKFYAIELEKIEENLLNKENLNIKDFIVLKIYRWTSFYSQSYILPLFWLILSGFIFTFFYPLSIGETHLEIFIKLINPFELISSNSLDNDYNVPAFISRVLSLFFIYHFIVSIKLKTGK